MKRLLRKLFKKDGEPNFWYKALFYPTFNWTVDRWIRRSVGKSDRVLDIGSRKLTYTKRLKCRQVFAIDMKSTTSGYLGWTESFLSEMRRGEPRAGLVVANAEDLPFRNGSLDSVVLIEVLEHIRNDAKAVSEISRVLSESGRLMLSTPNALKVPNENPFHVRHYDPEALEGLLKANFRRVRTWTRFPFIRMHVRQVKYRDPVRRTAFIFMNRLLNTFSFLFGRDAGYTLFARCEGPVTARDAGPVFTRP
jgi:SAM-dependent methyltransferase